jgi:SNF2 family DNA or RNA helicase
MLLSPRAGGVGLTLTAANHVIHLERWWNPAVEDQCTGRVLRIGQLRPVTAHVLQSICPERRSFDQNLHALLQRKRELVRDTLGSGEVSEDESMALLRDTIS